MVREKSLMSIVKSGYIPFFDGTENLDVLRLIEALIKGGVENMEVSCRNSTALKTIEVISKEAPEFIVGAASLIDSPQLLTQYNKIKSKFLPSPEQSVDAGAKYLVSLCKFRKETYETLSHKVLLIPGVTNQNEMVEQLSLGANLLKLSPIRLLGGSEWLSVLQPSTHYMLPFFCTGGVRQENLKEYIKAGTTVIGMGVKNLLEKEKLKQCVEENNYDYITEATKKLIDSIKEIREEVSPGIYQCSSVEELTQTTGRIFNL